MRHTTRIFYQYIMMVRKINKRFFQELKKLFCNFCSSSLSRITQTVMKVRVVRIYAIAQIIVCSENVKPSNEEGYKKEQVYSLTLFFRLTKTKWFSVPPETSSQPFSNKLCKNNQLQNSKPFKKKIRYCFKKNSVRLDPSVNETY